MLAEDLLENFHAKIRREMINNPFTTLGRIKENLTEVLPSKIRFKIKKNTSRDCMGYTEICINNPSVNGFEIGLEGDGEKCKINDKNLGTVIHEVRHLLDFICNPKIQMNLYNLNDDKINDFWANVLETNKYCPERKLEMIIRQFLKKYPRDTRIKALQQWRYLLLSEHKSCLAELKYISGKDFKLTRYSPKIDIVRSMLIKELRNARAEKNTAQNLTDRFKSMFSGKKS